MKICWNRQKPTKYVIKNSFVYKNYAYFWTATYWYFIYKEVMLWSFNAIGNKSYLIIPVFDVRYSSKYYTYLVPLVMREITNKNIYLRGFYTYVETK